MLDSLLVEDTAQVTVANEDREAAAPYYYAALAYRPLNTLSKGPKPTVGLHAYKQPYYGIENTRGP